jgi:hypothetical protein
LISKNRPKLAVCLYHKPMDLFEIPEFIIDLELDYDLYIRHQSLAQIDTILYAVPR